MKKYYDYENNRLVFIQQQANAIFWDEHWKRYDFKEVLPKYTFIEDFITKTTAKFLPVNSLILEGGCGLGHHVYKLTQKGYRAIGIDFAAETVEMLNETRPELDIRLGDITATEFPENFFDGYWSLGVIEHFYNGYRPILIEMKRIIKPGGYLFVTFPHLSRFRKFKVKVGKYEEFKSDPVILKDFYQFALDAERVKYDLENEGFTFLYEKKIDGLKGLKDEISMFRKTLQMIYTSRNLFFKVIAKALSLVFRGVASHSIMLVFRKNL